MATSQSSLNQQSSNPLDIPNPIPHQLTSFSFLIVFFSLPWCKGKSRFYLKFFMIISTSVYFGEAGLPALSMFWAEQLSIIKEPEQLYIFKERVPICEII